MLSPQAHVPPGQRVVVAQVVPRATRVMSYRRLGAHAASSDCSHVCPQSIVASSAAVRTPGRIAVAQMQRPKVAHTTVVAPAVVAAAVAPVVQPQCHPVRQTRTYPIVVVPRVAVPVASDTRSRVKFVPAEGRPAASFQDLPPELLQTIVDWLPNFQARARLRCLFRLARELEWRCAAPLYVDEELSSYDLGDIGVGAIAAGLHVPRNAVLKELCLGGNGITDAGAEALAAVLASGVTKLRRLSLRDNCIGDRGAQALAAVLSSTSTLEELDLWGNCLSEEAKRALVSVAQCEVFLELPTQSAAHSRPKHSLFDSRVRAILFDWISQVHVSAAAAVETAPDPQEMLFRTFSHMDAYLQHLPHNVQRAELQLVGVACTLVATGLEAKDAHAPECTELANWLALTTDGACTAEEVRDAAREVRAVLGSRLYQPTAYTFLRRYLRQTGWTEKSFSLANYLIELAALDSTFLEFRPQAVAAAAAVLSRQYASQGINRCHMPHWKVKLLRCAHVDLEQELAPCAAAMSRLHAAQHTQVANIFVNKKYEWSRLHSVAKLRPNPSCHPAYFVNYMTADADQVSAREA